MSSEMKEINDFFDANTVKEKEQSKRKFIQATKGQNLVWEIAERRVVDEEQERKCFFSFSIFPHII